MLKVKLNYSNRDPKEWEPDVYARFLEIWPCADKTTKQEYAYSYLFGTQRLTMEEAAEIEKLGLKMDIEGIDGTMLTKMQGQEKADKYGELQTVDIQNGTVVQITVPDIGLLQIDEVMVEDDCCTDRLRDRLEEGWRILAVCPPNAQRRPDYVLGRWTKNRPLNV